jgi:hypothetical protein
MSKNNVNPNHYKVAGRARQGEDIAQARNRQRYAEALVRERTEDGARSRKPAPDDGNALPDAGRSRSATTAARHTRATLLQTPPGHERGHNWVPGSSVPHRRSSKAARSASLRPAGVAPQRKGRQAATRASANVHGADKRGKRSTTQKRASSHHEFDLMPAANPVPGAFGKRPSPRPLPMRKIAFVHPRAISAGALIALATPFDPAQRHGQSPVSR